MIIEDNSSAPNDIQLTPLRDPADPSTEKSYEIAPEHRHHADAILRMDPVADVPSSCTVLNGWGASLRLRVDALPPEKANEVRAKLNALGQLTPEQRAAKEAEFVTAVIRSTQPELRIAAGVGAHAEPYHREMVHIAREVRDLNAHYDRIAAELTEVIGYDTRTNDQTGEKEAIPVYLVAGPRRDASIREQQAILGRIRLLIDDNGYGIEGKRRMDKALYESVAQRAALQEQIEDRAESKARARHNERERRINQQAELIGRMSRNES